MSDDEYNSKPISLFTFAVMDTDGKHLGKEEIRTMDIQMSKENAIKLVAMLNKDLDSNMPGAISFRLRGRLIL